MAVNFHRGIWRPQRSGNYYADIVTGEVHAQAFIDYLKLYPAGWQELWFSIDGDYSRAVELGFVGAIIDRCAQHANPASGDIRALARNGSLLAARQAANLIAWESRDFPDAWLDLVGALKQVASIRFRAMVVGHLLSLATGKDCASCVSQPKSDDRKTSQFYPVALLEKPREALS